MPYSSIHSTTLSRTRDNPQHSVQLQLSTIDKSPVSNSPPIHLLLPRPIILYHHTISPARKHAAAADVAVDAVDDVDVVVVDDVVVMSTPQSDIHTRVGAGW